MLRNILLMPDCRRRARGPEGNVAYAWRAHGFSRGVWDKKGECYDLAYLEKVAVEANPLVFQARQYLIWQQLELKNVKAGYLPTIDAYAGFEESTHNEFKRGQSANMRGNGYSGIDFQLLIYDFGKTDAKVVQQMQNVVSAEKI